MRRILVTLFLASILGGANCPNNQVALCEAQFRALCELEFRCCTAEERLENSNLFLGFFSSYVTSEGECIDRLSGICKTTGSVDEAVALGRVEFDATKAQECVAALHEARDSCDLPGFFEAASTTDEDSPCFGITTGLVKDGDACAEDRECEEGATCVISFDNPDIDEKLGAKEGECVGPAGVGESCEERACAEGLTCAFRDAGEVCIDPPGVGEPCPDFECDEGLACEFDDVTFENVCRPLPGNGEPCTFECTTGFFCDTADSTCAAQKDAGEACNPDNFDECVEDAFCDSQSSTCESLGGTTVPDDICQGT